MLGPPKSRDLDRRPRRSVGEESRGLSVAFAFQEIHTHIVDDPVQPRDEGTMRIEGVERFEEFEEDELHDVISGLRAARDEVGGAEDAQVMALEERGERRPVPRPGASDERAVLVVARSPPALCHSVHHREIAISAPAGDVPSSTRP